jgi:hypothetical protein
LPSNKTKNNNKKKKKNLDARRNPKKKNQGVFGLMLGKYQKFLLLVGLGFHQITYKRL